MRFLLKSKRGQRRQPGLSGLDRLERRQRHVFRDAGEELRPADESTDHGTGVERSRNPHRIAASSTDSTLAVRYGSGIVWRGYAPQGWFDVPHSAQVQLRVTRPFASRMEWTRCVVTSPHLLHICCRSGSRAMH